MLYFFSWSERVHSVHASFFLSGPTPSKRERGWGSQPSLVGVGRGMWMAARWANRESASGAIVCHSDPDQPCGHAKVRFS